MDGQMESLICLDTSVLIDFYRKTKKEKSFFYLLTTKYSGFVIPVTVHFELLVGNNEKQISFWQNLLEDFLVIPYHPNVNFTAIKIVKQLKTNKKSIEFKDLQIAATALHYNYTLATLNQKHFEDIISLKLITPNSFTQ